MNPSSSSKRPTILNTLTTHISFYNSQTPTLTPNLPSPTRTSILRWFASLPIPSRRAYLTILNPNFTTILLQMYKILISHNHGTRFFLLPDLPDSNSPLPSLIHRKSDKHALLSRFSQSNRAYSAIRNSVELFSSTESENQLRLDVMCVSESLVEDVDRFVEIMDEVSCGEFLRGGGVEEDGEICNEWPELGWLQCRGYYSFEEFLVNRIEVALRLSWMNCNGGGKKRVGGVRLKERLSCAGVAVNVFWRKNGCVDWWEKLDDVVRRKVYCAFLGKAARSLTDDMVKGKHYTFDRKMWRGDDRHKKPLRLNMTSLGREDIVALEGTDSEVSGDPSPLDCMLNSLYILQVVSGMFLAARCGEYEKKEQLFFSSLDSVNSVSDIILRKLRELLMVVSLDCTKFELLEEGNVNSHTNKSNEKNVTHSRKKKGKNHKKKMKPVPMPCQGDPKLNEPIKGDGDGIKCNSNQDSRQPEKFGCDAQEKDIARGNQLSADAMEAAQGVNKGKSRNASRKNRKERKKLKNSNANNPEVSSCKSRPSKVSPTHIASQDGPSIPDWTSGSSTSENVTNNVMVRVEKPDMNSNNCSYTSTESVVQHAENDCSVENGAEIIGNDSLTSGYPSSTSVQPVCEYNDNRCSGVDGCVNKADSDRVCAKTAYLGKQVKASEPERKPSLVQEKGSHRVLRVAPHTSSPAYGFYEWPNVAPIHPSASTHLPAAADRLHLDVGHNLQNQFHRSFVQPVQVLNSPRDNSYNGIISGPLPMSLDWPPVMRGVNRRVQSVTRNYDSDFISRRHYSLHQRVTAQSSQSEDERTVSGDLVELSDATPSQEIVDEHDKHWMSEEELEAHAVSGLDYNQFFGGGVMYWNPSDHPSKNFSRPPSLCSDDSSWAWREADMNRDVDDMVAFSSSYSTNGLTSPSAASFCSPFDPLGQGALSYVIPGSEMGSKVLHSSTTMTDAGIDENVGGSISNISGDGEVKTLDSLPYPILRPIITPNMSRERSRSDFRRSYDHKSPCVPPNRRENPRIKRPPSPVVLCVPRAPRPPPPSPVGDSRKHRGFPTVRSGSSSPRHWGVKSWFHDGVNFEEACIPMEGSEIFWPSWRNKGLSTLQLTQPLAGTLLQDRLIAISQLARDQEHPDVIFPLQPPESQNLSTRKAPVSLIHDILHDEIDSFCKQVAAENLVRKPYINWAVKRVARSLQVLWPRSRTNVFGSNATGLSLPSSDVDLVVCLPPVRNLEPIKEAGILEGRNGIKETCLQHAARYLANQEWVKSDSLKIVENTAIPIIMIVVEVPHDLISTTMSTVQTPNEEVEQVPSEEVNPFQTDAASSESSASPDWSKITNSNINDGFKSVRLDISFKSPTHTGLQTTALVKDLTERFPAVTPLSLVLKQFLADRTLDQAYSGGLSSYCLVLLITRFLQHEHHHGRPINQNYGSLLMDFLYFFGNVFDPRQMRISVQGSGLYMNRERGCTIDPLCIDDPLFLTNNVGRNCFRIHQCIKAFADAYAMLENEVTLPDDDESKARPTCKLLPKIVPSIGHLLGS